MKHYLRIRQTILPRSCDLTHEARSAELAKRRGYADLLGRFTSLSLLASHALILLVVEHTAAQQSVSPLVLRSPMGPRLSLVSTPACRSDPSCLPLLVWLQPMLIAIALVLTSPVQPPAAPLHAIHSCLRSRRHMLYATAHATIQARRLFSICFAVGVHTDSTSVSKESTTSIQTLHCATP